MPDEWRQTTWGEEISLEYGKALRDYNTAKGKFRVYGSNGPIGWTSQPLALGPGVILGRKGAYRGVQFSPDPFFVIDTAYYVVPKTELDMRWLFYAVQHHKLGEIDDGSPIPSTTRAAVYVGELQVPPITEQKAIAKILAAFDDKIELNRRMNETLEAMARAIFKSWFVDFDPVRAKSEGRKPAGMDEATAALFPNAFQPSPLGPIPKGWEVSTIGEDFRVVMGQSPPGESYNEEGQGKPFFQGRADFGFRFPTKRVHCTAPTRHAEAGDTLLSVRAPVGDMNIALEPCAIGRGVAALRHKSGSVSYTYHSLHEQAEAFGRFDGEGTVFGSINKDDLSRLAVLKPRPEVVTRFHELVAPLDELVKSNHLESITLAATRDTLLPKLLSGEMSATTKDA